MKIIIIGKRAVGKTFLCNMLEKEYGLKVVKSYTTRKQRDKNDNSHIFITRDWLTCQDDDFKSKMLTTKEINDELYFMHKNQIEHSDIIIVEPTNIAPILQAFPKLPFALFEMKMDEDLRLKQFMQRNPNIDYDELINKYNHLSQIDDDLFAGFNSVNQENTLASLFAGYSNLVGSYTINIKEQNQTKDIARDLFKLINSAKNNNYFVKLMQSRYDVLAKKDKDEYIIGFLENGEKELTGSLDVGSALMCTNNAEIALGIIFKRFLEEVPNNKFIEIISEIENILQDKNTLTLNKTEYNNIENLMRESVYDLKIKPERYGKGVISVLDASYYNKENVPEYMLFNVLDDMTSSGNKSIQIYDALSNFEDRDLLPITIGKSIKDSLLQLEEKAKCLKNLKQEEKAKLHRNFIKQIEESEI